MCEMASQIDTHLSGTTRKDGLAGWSSCMGRFKRRLPEDGAELDREEFGVRKLPSLPVPVPTENKMKC